MPQSTPSKYVSSILMAQLSALIRRALHSRIRILKLAYFNLSPQYVKSLKSTYLVRVLTLTIVRTSQHWLALHLLVRTSIKPMVKIRTRPEFRCRFRWNLGRYQFIWPVPDWYRFYLDNRFSMFCTNASQHHVPPSVPWLDHVQCAPLQFSDCITCYPPVPRLYHVLPSSSQTV